MSSHRDVAFPTSLVKMLMKGKTKDRITSRLFSTPCFAGLLWERAVELDRVFGLVRIPAPDLAADIEVLCRETGTIHKYQYVDLIPALVAYMRKRMRTTASTTESTSIIIRQIVVSLRRGSNTRFPGLTDSRVARGSRRGLPANAVLATCLGPTHLTRSPQDKLRVLVHE